MIEIYSIWPYFACMALLLVLAATPAFAAADSPPSPRPDRLPMLDGLRGFLALAVVFHHGAIYHRFLFDGQWELPPSRFYTLLGQVGVSIFFMITGYLFWSQLIEKAGKPNWLRLYVGRIFRIGPLYLGAAIAMMIIVFTETGMHLNVTLYHLTRQIIAWSMLGAVNGPEVNSYADTGIVLAGVTWTLRYEWIFYLILPVTALAARKRRVHLPFVVIGLASLLFWAALNPSTNHNSICSALFLTGMTCASLQRGTAVKRIPDRIASVLVLALLVVTFAIFQTAYTVGVVILLGAVFYLITSGCTVFGLLVSRPARRLGDVSYGIYLLQGLVLAAVFWPGPLRAADLASPVYHWMLVLLCAVLLIAVATAAHAGIERPGIALGKHLAVALEARKLSARSALPDR